MKKEVIAEGKDVLEAKANAFAALGASETDTVEFQVIAMPKRGFLGIGATPAKAFLQVTLPLSKAGIMSGVSMVFLPSMTNYVVSNYMTFNHTKIIGAFIDECFKNDLWNLGSVTALLLLTLMFVITWLTGGFDAQSETGTRGTSLW